jgi:hypothetical protein
MAPKIEQIERARPLESIVKSAGDVDCSRSSRADSRAGQPAADVERWLRPKEAAAFLRVSVSWLAKSRMRGDGPEYAKLNRDIRYGQSKLAQYMKSRQRRSTSE